MRIPEGLLAALRSINRQKEKPGAKEWLASRKEAGQEIDPETAEVICRYVHLADPYGVCADFPEELDYFSRVFFARSSDSDIWVAVEDLPKATVERLMQSIDSGDFGNLTLRQDRSRVAPLTRETAQAEVQVALRRNIWTGALSVGECSQLPDGRFQFTVAEHRADGSD